jgi:hypothetical protein
MDTIGIESVSNVICHTIEERFGYRRADDRPLEAPLREAARDWPAGDPTPRTEAIGNHAGLAGKDPGGEPT